MATSYTECYDVFLSQIDDIEYLFPFPNETELEFQARLESNLLMLFNRAVRKFTNPKTKLTRDDTSKTFSTTLREIEIEVIGMLMLKEYYRKKLNFLVQLKHSFSDKDWKSHDKSSAMSQYRQLLNETNKEIKSLIIANSYSDESGDFSWVDMTVDSNE